jgi:hypothetical protein
MRRRRNPTPFEWGQLALLGGAAYLVWKYVVPLFQKLPQVQQQAASSVTDFVEKLFPYGGAGVMQDYPNATIILGDGSEIPTTATSGSGLFTDVDNVQKVQFYYAGHTYRTTTAMPDSTNTYYAAMLNGLGASGGNWRGL